MISKSSVPPGVAKKFRFAHALQVVITYLRDGSCRDSSSRVALGWYIQLRRFFISLVVQVLSSLRHHAPSPLAEVGHIIWSVTRESFSR